MIKCLIWCFWSFLHFLHFNVPDNKWHKQRYCMLFFTYIKLMASVLACASAIACIKWRRLRLLVVEKYLEKCLLKKKKKKPTLVPHLFLFRWLKLNLNNLITWDWLRNMNTGSSCDQCWCLSFFAFSHLTCNLKDSWSSWGDFRHSMQRGMNLPLENYPPSRGKPSPLKT